MGNLLKKLNKLDEALKYFMEALEFRYKYLPENHQDIDISLNFLGNYFYDLEKYIQAQKYYRDSLEFRLKNFPLNDQNIISSLNKLGILLH